jgi:hypothetical protein
MESNFSQKDWQEEILWKHIKPPHGMLTYNNGIYIK